MQNIPEEIKNIINEIKAVQNINFFNAKDSKTKFCQKMEKEIKEYFLKLHKQKQIHLNQISIKDGELERIKKQFKVLKQRLIIAENQKKALEGQSRLLKQNMRSDKIIGDQEKIILEKELEKIKDEIKQKNKEKQLLNQKSNELIQIIKSNDKKRQEIKSIQKQLQNLRQLKQKFETELEKIKAQKNQQISIFDTTKLQLQQLKKQLQKAKQIPPLKPYTEYNIEIKLKTINEFVNGVEMYFCNEVSEFNLQKIVGIIGGEKTGKTYILNKLTGDNYKCGYQNSTIGISMKTPSMDQQELKNVLFMDTTGSDKAVEYNVTIENCKEKQIPLLKQCQQLRNAQRLIEQYVIKTSKIIIVMVNQLNINDQQRILNILLNGSTDYKQKIFYVIHNFKNITKQQILNEKIESDIIKGCLAKRQFGEIMNSNTNKVEEIKYFVSESKAGCQFYHYILVQDQSDLAKEINWKTYESLKIQIRNPMGNKLFKVPQTFMNFCKTYLKNCYHNSQNLSIKNEVIKEDRNSFQISKFTLDKGDNRLTLRKGNYNILGRKIDTNWSYTLVKNKKKKMCQIYLDLPGMIKNISFQLGSNKFKLHCYQILIKYKRDWQNTIEDSQILCGNRDIDPQRNEKIEIPIDGSDMKIEFDIDEIKKNRNELITEVGKGVYRIELPEMINSQDAIEGEEK